MIKYVLGEVLLIVGYKSDKTSEPFFDKRTQNITTVISDPEDSEITFFSSKFKIQAR